jgi:hypothetical protein
MKVQALEVDGANSGKMRLKSGMTNSQVGNQIVAKRVDIDWIEIKKGRYIQNDTSHPLRLTDEKLYGRIYALEYKNKYIYWLNTFGAKSKDHGVHIGLSWCENQRFLWMQNDHWFQKEDNIRYIVNVLFLIIGAWIGIKSLK